MSAPNSRPVHPCVLSLWDGNSGAEYSTWANISCARKVVPDLVTAQGSTLTILKMEETTGKLLLHKKFSNLAGNVCFLRTLKSPGTASDSLLIGFSGHPRLSIVSVTPDLLMATSLLDLTVALQENAYGATAPLEQDLTASLFQTSPNMATLTVILGEEWP